MTRRLFALCAAALVFASTAFAAAPSVEMKRPTAPTPATHEAMIVAADPRAAQAAKAMLDQGGDAVDAAIAAMAVLGLVEPQSAGVGGGGFLLYYDHRSSDVTAFDGREAAPAGATPQYFFGDDGKPLPFPLAVASGRSTGAPTLYAMLKLAHEKRGRLPWAKLFEPAIKLADEGFVVSPRMSASIAAMAGRSALKLDPAARAYLFQSDGTPLPAGYLLKNPQYAATLRSLASEGPKALQDGPIADAIIAAVHQAPRPGILTKADLAAVSPHMDWAVCGAYRTYKVCGAPPPTSGGVAVIDILGLFARARPRPAGPQDPDDWASFMWASRVAYADRDYYLADARKVPVPVKGLIAPRYLDERAKVIRASEVAPAVIAPGAPAGAPLGRWGAPGPATDAGTTHMSIIDKDGDAVAMTASIEAPFGSERMAAGFFLNNQLTDFSRDPELNGKPVANAVAAFKKPRSSMAPTMVFDRQGKLYAVIGSPGGSSIIAYVAKAIIGVVDWRLTMQQAVDLPNVVAMGPRVAIERDRFPAGANAVLSARGWQLVPSAGEISGLNGILVTPQGLDGGADSRREGVALKD